MSKKLHLFSSLIICLLAASGLHAQVTGTVTDLESGDPLIGVNIVQKNNTSSGTTTDLDGRYSIAAQPGDTLIFSYTGFGRREIVVNAVNEVIDITMTIGNELLDEIVVVGYGIQKKRVSTGSISKISNENLEGFQVQDVQSALEGQVSGLIVNESSGQPGASKSILIRGVSTNGDNSPLYIVDGLQVNNIDNINPGDIESVDVLKDAASSAIYGARAANGVVIITTKKGKKGQGTISYEGFASVSNPWKLPEMLGAQDYVALTREKFANGNQLSSLETLGFPQVGDETVNTDWMDVIFEPATVQSHRLTATGEDVYFSLEYWDQEGVVGGEKSLYERYSARLNASKDLNEYVTIGENLYVNRVNNQNIGINDAFGTVIADAFSYDPLTPVYDESMQYGFGQSEWVRKEYVNPLSRLFITNNEGFSDQVLGNVYLEIRPIPGLRFRSDAGLDYSWFKFRSFVPDYEFHEAFVNPENDVSQGYGYFETLQFENYLNYTNTFGKHEVDFLLGTSYRTTASEFAGGSTQSIPQAVQFDPNWQFIDAGQDTTDLSYGNAAVDYALISYFGRLLYNYDGKYLFSATLRRDGSSNFGANNRWGLFPSFSAGWVLSEEPFFRYDPISFMKLRASWGTNGNDRIAPLAYAATIENVFRYPFGTSPSLLTGAALATPPNPNIRWEESIQFDVGLEVRMLDDKLIAEFDYYRKTTSDLLMNQIIPGYLGATNDPLSNLGEIQNEGIEAMIGYRVSLGKLKLSANFNYTTFRNEVTRVAGESGFLQGYSWPVRNTPITRMTEGFPVGHFVGYVADGIFQSQEEVFSHINSQGQVLQPKAEPGDIRFLDINGDGEIDSEDITDIGSPWPDHILGLTLSANYGGFDFSAVLSAQLGHEIYRTYERSDITFTNYQTFWLDRWTPENPSNEYPRLVSTDPNNNQRPSSFYVEDASFLRLRNLQIGYNFSPELLSKVKLSGLRIYFSANNLLTVTGYKGFDPDIGTNNGWILDTGIDKGFYPSNRTFGGGIKITM